MEMARCIIENGRAELIQTYPESLYEGETADPANQSDYPSIFDEPPDLSSCSPPTRSSPNGPKG